MSISDVVKGMGEIKPRKTHAPRSYRDDHWLEKENVAWLVSNCWAKRMIYVKELAKHIDVAIFGRCGEHECPKHSDSYMAFLN